MLASSCWSGSALLFLLPVLELRGLREICPLSLSSTLSSAATLCTGLTREQHICEAFTFAIQNQLEQCVLQDDINYKALIEMKFKGNPK